MDDILLIDDTCIVVNNRLEVRRQILESKGFRLSKTKNKTKIQYIRVQVQ